MKNKTLTIICACTAFAFSLQSQAQTVSGYEATITSPTDGGSGPVLFYSNVSTADANGHMVSTGSNNSTIFNLGDVSFTGAFGNPNFAYTGLVNQGVSGSSSPTGALADHLAGNNGTVSLLFKTPTSFTGFESLFNRGFFGQSKAFEIGVEDDGDLRLVNNSTTSTVVKRLSTDTWYYAALRFNLSLASDDLTWYVGELGSSVLDTGSITITNGALEDTTIYVGGRSGTSAYRGSIQALATWDRTLSDGAIQSQFAATGIPEPTTYALLFGISCLSLVACRRCR